MDRFARSVWGLAQLTEELDTAGVAFRGTYHAASHPTLVEAEAFHQAQEILRARGEDHTKRAGNASEYLLSGRITCPACAKRYLGNAAHSNKCRYRYYTGFARLRYGKKTAGPPSPKPSTPNSHRVRRARQRGRGHGTDAGGVLRAARRHRLRLLGMRAAPTVA